MATNAAAKFLFIAFSVLCAMTLMLGSSYARCVPEPGFIKTHVFQPFLEFLDPCCPNRWAPPPRSHTLLPGGITQQKKPQIYEVPTAGAKPSISQIH
jgi:hypothetical protein